MTPITVDSLYAWLALPVGTNLLVDALSEARERYTDQLGRLLFDAADFEQDPQAVAETAAGLPAAEDGDAVTQAAMLLLRAELLDRRNDGVNRERSGRGMLPGPAPEVASVGAALGALAAQAPEGLHGLTTVLTAQASATQAVHATDPLGSVSRRFLRDAVDRMTADMPRRWIAWAFGVFASAASTAGRADLWMEEVGNLLTVRGGDIPADLAWAVARQACTLIARDARWERAEETRRQAEQLLDPVPGEDADVVRVELAVSLLHNPDLDERPWTETADEVVTDLVGRLGYAGVNQTLAECGNLLLSTAASPERKTELLHRWSQLAADREMLDLSVASGTGAVVRDLESDEEATDAPDAPDAQHSPATGDPAASPLPGVPRGVPAGLYSEDFRVRHDALVDEFGGWAFRGILATDDAHFSAAATACAEMYTRGIHDEAEVVREQSVIFARRLIAGFARRGDDAESLRWQRQVLADTTGMTSPKCVRARVQALWDLTCSTDDEQESASAERDLGVLLEDNNADYAVIIRGALLRRRATRLPEGAPKIRLLEQVAALYVQAVDLDEWEEQNWPEMIRSVSGDLVDAYRVNGDAVGMLAGAERYVEWMGSPVTAEALHGLNYRVLRHLAVIPDSVEQQLIARRDALFARAATVSERATEQVRMLAGAFDVFEGEGDLWRTDHDLPLGQAATTAAGTTGWSGSSTPGWNRWSTRRGTGCRCRRSGGWRRTRPGAARDCSAGECGGSGSGEDAVGYAHVEENQQDADGSEGLGGVRCLVGLAVGLAVEAENDPQQRGDEQAPGAELRGADADGGVVVGDDHDDQGDEGEHGSADEHVPADATGVLTPGIGLCCSVGGGACAADCRVVAEGELGAGVARHGESSVCQVSGNVFGDSADERSVNDREPREC